MSAIAERVWSVEPFREGSREDCARLRDVLSRAGYTDPGIISRLEIKSIYDFRQVREGRPLLNVVNDPQSLLVRLFLDAEAVSWEVVRSMLSAADLAAIEALGLLHSDPRDPAQCLSTVLLYPTEGMYIVSDRNIDRDALDVPPDVVYPAVTTNTRRFLGTFSRRRCDAFLELCSGTGIAALVAARGFARHAWAVDITGRATRFARFNAMMNDIENLTALEGDLYEPVQGQTFDRIVAHPPYVPAFENEYIFRDGGEDGEQITRRVIAGLSDHLRPGGRFYCNCLATDRVGAPLEQRVRGMLGDTHEEFDVAVLQAKTHEPGQYYFNLLREGRGTPASLGRRIEAFKRLEVEELFFGSIIVQRRSGPRPVFTARRQLGVDSAAPEFEWLLQWEEVAMHPSVPARLLDMQVRSNKGLIFRSMHELKGRDWMIEKAWVDVRLPFALEAVCPPWIAALLSAADGHRTGRELLTALKEREIVPPEASEAEFAEMLFRFVGAGMLDTAEFPLPGSEPRPRRQKPGTAD